MKKMTIVLLILSGLLAACNVEPELTAAPSDAATPQPQESEDLFEVPTLTPASGLDYSKLPECLQGISAVEAQVLEVVDGDTIHVDMNGVRAKVRYVGIDTPEMDAADPTLGQQAKEYNEAMVKDKTVYLLKGDTDRDSYGRLLRFVIVDGMFVNQKLINKGLATSFNRPHDARCAALFDQEQYTAFTAGQGIWRGFGSDYTPTVEPVCPQGCNDHIANCDIKGNISQSGDYIFHLPGTKEYKNTSISANKGERWFCTIDEAVANGFRPPRSE